MLFVGLYSSCHSVVQPYVLKIVLDAAATAGTGGFITACLKPALMLMGMSLIVTAIWRFYNFIVLKSLPDMKADIVQRTTEHLRGQSFTFFQDHLSGAISAKISDLTSNIQNIVNAWFNISRQGLTVILSIGMASFVHPYFAVVFASVSIAFLFMAYHCSTSIKPFAKEYAEARAKNSGCVVDCFSNVLNMLLFARESYEAEYLKKTTIEAVTKDKSMQFKNMVNASLLGAFAWSLEASSIFLLLYLGDQGLISVGDFAFIFMLSLTVIDQVWYLTESLLTIGEKMGVCQQALDTIFTPHQQKRNPDDQVLEVTKGEIVFDQVSFGYKVEDVLFKNKNIIIPGGTKVGLVGYSGGGKSTFVNLITRLFDVNEGEIRIDGKAVDEVSRQSLRNHIAFIPQLPSLFHRSILENIQYGKVDASLDEVIEASKKAHAHEFIEKLPDGYNTVVGERGIKLSGGQRQRIAIARAILKDAPILILDEATSSLDSLTEEQIQKALKNAMQGKTVIVIAHRLSTVLSMDTILVFDKGAIIEQGSHQELIEANGFYKRLWDSQSGHSYI